MHLILTLRKNGYVQIDYECGQGEYRSNATLLFKKLPVVYYDRPVDKYRTTIHWVNRLIHQAQKCGHSVSMSKRLEKYHRRFKEKEAKYIEIDAPDKFSLDKWTDDPEYQLLPHQVLGASLAWMGRGRLMGDSVGLGKTPQSNITSVTW